MTDVLRCDGNATDGCTVGRLCGEWLRGLRRTWLFALVAVFCASASQAQSEFTPRFGPPTPFSFDVLKDRAADLANRPFEPHAVQKPDELDAIDYDAHWRIRFRPEATVHVGDVPLQFFHLGRYFREPVTMHVVEGGEAREILYDADFFDIPADSPALAMEDVAGFAGFRVMRDDLQTD
jgi:glucans biosynthesis protein